MLVFTQCMLAQFENYRKLFGTVGSRATYIIGFSFLLNLGQSLAGISSFLKCLVPVC